MIICMHTFTIWLNRMALWRVTKIMTRLRRTQSFGSYNNASTLLCLSL